MKKLIIALIAAALTIMTSCSKNELEDIKPTNGPTTALTDQTETETDGNASDPSYGGDPAFETNYARNYDLVEKNSSYYFIADIVGLTGINHMNFQSALGDSYGGSSSGCSSNHQRYGSKVQKEDGNQQSHEFQIFFAGECPACYFEDVLKTGKQQLSGPSERYNGTSMHLEIHKDDGSIETFYSHLTPENERMADVRVLENKPTPNWKESNDITAEVSITLTSAKDRSRQIRLENGVFRGKIKTVHKRKKEN